MVLGVEKMTSQATPRVTEILASAGDCSGEIRAGSTFPSLFAMIARRHMHDFGTKREHLANGGVLEPSELTELAALGRSLEERFGAPQDVEWAIAGGRLFLLQSRPVTTL